MRSVDGFEMPRVRDDPNGRRRGWCRSICGVRQMRAGVLLVAWIWICGCDVTGLPHGAQRFTPPAQYRAWWALTEACSGLHGDFNSVTWYTVPNTNTFTLEGTLVNGAWYGDPNRIVLGDSVKFAGSLVRHEMLHALLQVIGHPRQQFLGNCSDIVVCIEKCVSDAGGPPDTSESAPLLGPSVLPAAVLLAPDTVSMAADSGWTTVTVSITNRTSGPGLEQVVTFDSMPRGIVVYHAIPPDFGDDEVFTDYYMTLAPTGTAGSTRRIVFDLQAPIVTTPTRYVVNGMFGESAAPGRTLTVTP